MLPVRVNGLPVCEILIGDVLAKLAQLPDESVDIVVTSPPYWGLRDYGVEGQLGMEPTWQEHLDNLIRVFDEIWRVLKPTGTVWLNYGDCYATQPNGRSAADVKALGSDDRGFVDKPFSTIQGVFKAKDLCMLPARLAIALQEAGWWVRSENIWAKNNPMPESIKDRPAMAHEKIYLLSKNGNRSLCWRHDRSGEWVFARPEPDYVWINRLDHSEVFECPDNLEAWRRKNLWSAYDYYYEAEAVRQGRSGNTHSRGTKKSPPIENSNVGHVRWSSYMRDDPEVTTRNLRNCETSPPSIENKPDKQRGAAKPHQGFNDRWDKMSKAEQQANGRNLRNWEPAPLEVWPMATMPFKEAHFATFPPELVRRCLLAGCPPGGLVLDPFGGAGTTGFVAASMGFDSVLIELNPDYAAIARKRIDQILLGEFEHKSTHGKEAARHDDLALFAAAGE